MNGQGQQLSVALLSVGVIALGATQYLGSPWPGVVLCGLALLPWGLEVVMACGQSAGQETLAVMSQLLEKHTDVLQETQKRLEEHGQQINSLRNTASLRGTLGG